MSKIIAVAAATLALFVVAPAFAADAPTKMVDLSKVNFRDPAAVQAFYSELAQTAAAVCNSGSNSAALIEEDRACARQTLADAVARLNKPTVTALHNNEKADTQFAGR